MHKIKKKNGMCLGHKLIRLCRSKMQLFLEILSILYTIHSTFADQCGISNPNPNEARSLQRILGGYEIDYFKYPWFAQIYLDEHIHCGGSLISEGLVVTAAHCFKGGLHRNYSLYLGVQDNCLGDRRETFSMKQIHVHDKYKIRDDPYFDIALVKLDGNTNKYQPICLPSKPMSDRTRGSSALIQGMGNTAMSAMKPGNKIYEWPCKLHEAKVRLYSEQECRKMIRRNADPDSNAGTRMTHVFCAGYLEGGIDACQGDSGGPIVQKRDDDKYFLIGLTSFGYSCAKMGALGIYTDITHFLDWISQVSGH